MNEELELKIEFATACAVSAFAEAERSELPFESVAADAFNYTEAFFKKLDQYRKEHEGC